MRLASADVAAPCILDVLARDGSAWVRESSESMGPLMRAGDRLRLVAAARVAAGDVIAYHRGGDIVVHRVITSRGTVVITKGDALFRRDEPVALDTVVGRVATVAPPGASYIELDSARWRALARVLAVMSRLAERVAPTCPALPTWRRLAWMAARLPMHVVAWTVR